MPVGFAGVEQGADSVVVEPVESERGPLDPFDQVVGGFGGALVTRCWRLDCLTAWRGVSAVVFGDALMAG